MKEATLIRILEIGVLFIFILSLIRQFVLSKRVEVVENTSEYLQHRIFDVQNYVEEQEQTDEEQERQDEIISIAISMSLDSVQKIPPDSVLTINLPTEFRQNVERAKEMYDIIVDHYHRIENIPR
jgi:hypothetical protein